MLLTPAIVFFFFFNDTATTEIYTLSLHDALPISSGLRLAGVLTELGRHHAIVTLERRAQVLDELATHAPERLNLAPDLRFLAARALQDLLAVQLGLPHVELRLAPGRGLHLIAEPLSRDEGVLDRLLAVGNATRPLLERDELLFQERVFPQHRLVVLGDVVEEGVHLVGVEAAQHLDRELLLPDVEGTDTHRDLRLAT